MMVISPRKAMRQHNLKKLAKTHLLTGVFHRLHKRFFAGIGLEFMRDAYARQPGLGQLGLKVRKPLMQDILSRPIRIAQVVQVQKGAFSHMVIGQQNIGKKEAKILSWNRWWGSRKGLEQANKIIGKGTIQPKKAILTAKGLNQLPDHLRNIVELQTLILSHRTTLARHRTAQRSGRALHIATARQILRLNAIENRPTPGIERPNGKRIVLALDDKWRIHRGQGITAVDR